MGRSLEGRIEALERLAAWQPGAIDVATLDDSDLDALLEGAEGRWVARLGDGELADLCADASPRTLNALISRYGRPS